MENNNLYFNDSAPHIDSSTRFVVGSQEYNDYYYPKIEKQDFDPRPIDKSTDAGKGISYKTCDGKDVATIEEVMRYNQMYYEKMKISDNHIESKGIHK